MSLSSKDLFPIVHYEYGEAYFGSLSGMRFRVAREPLVNVHYKAPDERGECMLRASAWPEPDSYRTAPPEHILTKDFPFTQEGLETAAAWLNEIHDSHMSFRS